MEDPRDRGAHKHTSRCCALVVDAEAILKPLIGLSVQVTSVPCLNFSTQACQRVPKPRQFDETLCSVRYMPVLMR